MKKTAKRLIMTAVLVVGFTSVAGAASANTHFGPKSPCKDWETFCFVYD